MTEEEILQTVEEHCQETGIYFQVFLQVPYLYIYINREAEHYVDYNTLSEKILGAIATLAIPDLQGISLHSRIFGTVEPDWETYLELPAFQTDSDEVVNDDLPEPESENLPEESELFPEPILVETQETNLSESSPEPVLVETKLSEIEQKSTSEVFDLSKCCFTRNHSLVTATLPHPSANIAKMVDFFHVLPNKQVVVPFLNDIFNAAKTPNTNNHPESIQQWVKEIVELDEEKKRKASIWFSRYCLNSTATMEQVTAVLVPIAETSTPSKTEETKPQKTTEKTEPSLLTAPKYKPPTSVEKQPTQTVAASRPQKTATRKKSPTWQPSSIHLAIAWVIFTVFAVMLNLRIMSAVLKTSLLCENSPSPDRCELAVQMLGAPTIELATKSHPSTPSERTKAAAEYEGVIVDVYTPPYGLSKSADATCAFYGTIKAGMNFKEVSKMRPKPISTEGKIILPGVYLVDVKANNFKGGSEPVRTACVFHYQENQQKVDVKTLAIEVIPTQWPEVSYETISQPIALQKVSSVFDTLSVLGTGTLFTAIGIYVAIILGLGIRANTLDTIFKASFFLGIIETLLSFIPIFFVAKIALETLALSLTSAVVKDFKVEWSMGYPVVAAGALVIMILRTLLNWIVLSLLFTWMS